MNRCRYQLLLNPLLLCFWISNLQAINGVSLEQALVEDLMPESSELCVGSGTTFHTEEFYSTQAVSQWDATALPFEEEAFLAEFGHVDANVNRSWTLRVGHGGTIYSFIGSYGEAMPPQAHNGAPWIDEVWQMVAVNTALNDAQNDPYFIHQAGTYQNTPELLQRPFYSPNLARYCDTSDDKRECAFISWGQQAHVPTAFNSSLLYYTRVRDCGNGALEVTSIFHNAGKPDESEYWNYFNIPWAGVRTSTFTDFLQSFPNGTSAQIWPQPAFGDTGGNNIPNLDTTGGYFTFTQNLPLPSNVLFEVPCGDASGDEVDCSTALAQPLSLTIASNNACTYSASHTSSWGRYTVRCTLNPTVAISTGCRDCTLEFENGRGDSFQVHGVLHWSWTSQSWYLWPMDSLNYTVDYLNTILLAGDSLTVRWADFGLPAEDNLALSFVHGIDSDRGSWSTGKGRIRRGLASRDYTVYTRNAFMTLVPGQSYQNTQFVISDRLADIEQQSKQYAPQTFQNVVNAGDVTGRVISLWKHVQANDSDANHIVTATVENRSCSNGVLVCTGSTTPQQQHLALYAIECGNLSYIGFDAYFFSPADAVNHNRQPWICDGMNSTIRPSWKLLGFFPTTNECPTAIDQINDYAYDSNAELFCSPPTTQPTTAPPTTAQPTAHPTTAQPTTAQPTTAQPTTAQPTTTQPTTVQSTTVFPTQGPATSISEKYQPLGGAATAITSLNVYLCLCL